MQENDEAAFLSRVESRVRKGEASETRESVCRQLQLATFQNYSSRSMIRITRDLLIRTFISHGVSRSIDADPDLLSILLLCLFYRWNCNLEERDTANSRTGLELDFTSLS